jgi:hypothetical protein
MIICPRRDRLEALSDRLSEFGKIQEETEFYRAAATYHGMTAEGRFGNYSGYDGYRLSTPAVLPGGGLCRPIDRPRRQLRLATREGWRSARRRATFQAPMVDALGD